MGAAVPTSLARFRTRALALFLRAPPSRHRSLPVLLNAAVPAQPRRVAPHLRALRLDLPRLLSLLLLSLLRMLLNLLLLLLLLLLAS